MRPGEGAIEDGSTGEEGIGYTMREVAKFLVSSGFSIQESGQSTPTQATLQISGPAVNALWTMQAIFSANNLTTIRLISFCALRASTTNLTAVNHVINKYNTQMVVGNFELDYRDGEVRMKSSIATERNEPQHRLSRIGQVFGEMLRRHLTGISQHGQAIIKLLATDGLTQGISDDMKHIKAVLGFSSSSSSSSDEDLTNSVEVEKTVTQLELQKKLAKGEHTRLFGSTHDGKEVVVKVFQGPLTQTPEFNAILTNVVAKATKLPPHPHVHAISALYQGATQTGIVSSAACKTSLQDILRKGTKDLPLPAKLSYIMEVARGMGFLHYQKITHGGLKPSNVVIDGANHAKVADGLLLKLRAFLPADHSPISLPYIAPEVLSKGYAAATPNSDIYSFGILVWALLSGHTPFIAHAGCPSQITVAVLSGQRPSLAQLPEGTPKELKDLTEECWSADVSTRPDFATILTRLESIAAAE